ADTLEQRLERLPVVADILSSSHIVSAVYAGYGNGDFFLFRKLQSSGAAQFPDAPVNSHFLLQSLVRSETGHQGSWRFYDRNLNLIEHRELASYDYDPRQRPWYQAAQESASQRLSGPYAFITNRDTCNAMSPRASGNAATVLG